MNNIMSMNGYNALIEYNGDLKVFVGTVLGLPGPLVFYGTSLDRLQEDFRVTVEDYYTRTEGRAGTAKILNGDQSELA